MGCAASSSATTVNSKQKVVKFYFGTADTDVFGVGTDKALIKTRAAFEAGRSSVFLLTVPAARQQQESYTMDAAGEAANDAAEAAEATAAAADDAAGSGRPQEERGEKKEATKPVMRWAVYNDGKSEAKITCTFFHADEVKVLADASSAKENRMEGGRLQVELTVPGTKTVPFVEGPIGGYMWKCEVKNAEGTYDLARTFEEKPAEDS